MASTLLLDLGPAGGAHGQRGIGRYVRGVASSLEALPPQVVERLWAMGDPSTERSPIPAGRFVESRLGAPFDRMPVWVRGRVIVGHAARRSGASAFHSTDPHRAWLPSVRRLAVTAYDLIPLREPETLRSLRADHRWMYGRYLAQLRAADRVIAISHTTAADLRDRLGIDPDRIDVVYPVVAPQDTARDPSSEPTFLVVGALDPHKRPELAVRALAAFRARGHDGRLRFIGPADPDQVRGILAEAQRSGAGPQVTVEGRISDAALEAAYATATAVLSVSSIEGFGLPPVEALVRGIPVIAADTDAARETIGSAGVIVDADPDAFAEAMVDPTAPTAAMIDAVRARFALATSARALASAYGRLLDEEGERRPTSA